MGPCVNSQLFPRASRDPKNSKSRQGLLNKSKLARLKTMAPLELDGAPGEEPAGPLEQVWPIKQESVGPFGDNGGP